MSDFEQMAERLANMAISDAGFEANQPIQEQPLATAAYAYMEVEHRAIAGPPFPCRECGWECENKIGLTRHTARHNFVAKIGRFLMTCWFCNAHMVEQSSIWPSQERINHIVRCYERHLAGVDVAQEATRARSEMSFSYAGYRPDAA